ncbi:hypothetical protein EF908_07085, partial [Streptomyces sp. WAC04770]
MQGGGLSQRGALVIDDNAADARAQPRDAAPRLPVGLSMRALAYRWVVREGPHGGRRGRGGKGLSLIHISE